MKGLETSLVVVVTAIVVLIAAVVLLTIFGQGVGPISGIIEQANICLTKGQISCTTTGKLPPDWSVQFLVRDSQGKETTTSCSSLVNGDCGSLSAKIT